MEACTGSIANNIVITFRNKIESCCIDWQISSKVVEPFSYAWTIGLVQVLFKLVFR